MSKLVTYSVIGVGVGMVSFVWEYVAKKKKSEIKPSVALNYLSNVSTEGFTKLGTGLATVSSFYTYLDFSELYQASGDLVKPVAETIVSPCYTIKGYYDKTTEFKYPMVVGFGSLTLLSTLGASYLAYTKYGVKLPELTKFLPNKFDLLNKLN